MKFAQPMSSYAIDVVLNEAIFTAVAKHGRKNLKPNLSRVKAQLLRRSQKPRALLKQACFLVSCAAMHGKNLACTINLAFHISFLLCSGIPDE